MFHDFCDPLQIKFAHLHYVAFGRVLVWPQWLGDLILEHFLEELMKHGLEGAGRLAAKAPKTRKISRSYWRPLSRRSQIERRLHFRRVRSSQVICFLREAKHAIGYSEALIAWAINFREVNVRQLLLGRPCRHYRWQEVNFLWRMLAHFQVVIHHQNLNEKIINFKFVKDPIILDRFWQPVIFMYQIVNQICSQSRGFGVLGFWVF